VEVPMHGSRGHLGAALLRLPWAGAVVRLPIDRVTDALCRASRNP